MSVTMTMRLDEDIKEWQVAETRAALTEADAGEVASDADVEALARKRQ